ncbi:Metallophos domain-containing protein, partial [Trichostrongylus colubriformis]
MLSNEQHLSGVELWTLFQHVFNCLPMAGLVGTKIFCAHGGISEDLISFKQFDRVYRPTDVCDIGLLCDLIWSDPSTVCSMFDPSPRGVSSVFGKQAVINFCSKMNVDLVCRAHQCVMD